MPPDFDEALYLAQNPDVAANWGSTPYAHWLMYGQYEGRPYPRAVAPVYTWRDFPAGGLPPPLDFDTDLYLRQNPDITPARWERLPFQHWLDYGQHEGRTYPYKVPLPETVIAPGGDLRYYEAAIRALEAKAVPLYGKDHEEHGSLLSTIQHDASWTRLNYPINWGLYETSRGTRIAGLAFTIGASVMLAYAGGAAWAALSGAGGAAAGAAGGAGASSSAATSAALIESGTVGVAGAALETAALSGTAATVGTVAGADLAALVESGAVGAEGAVLEAAALSGSSVAYNTATGALLESLSAPGLPQLEPQRPLQLEPQQTAPRTLVDALKPLGARLVAALGGGGGRDVSGQAAPAAGVSQVSAPADSPIPFLIIAGLVLALVS